MLDLFSRTDREPVDTSRFSAVDLFNNRLAPTYNRLEEMAGTQEEIDLDGHGSRIVEEREQRAQQDDEFYQERARQDDEFLAGASGIFGQESQADNPLSFSPLGGSQESLSGEDFTELPEQEDGRPAKIITQKSGRVNPKSLGNFIGKQIASSPLNGFVPKDGARYGITKGTPQEWSRFFTGLAKLESSFNNKTKGDIGKFKGDSNGLFQLSPEDARNHRLKDSEFTLDELRDPELNTKAAIAIASRLMLQDGVIAKGKKGAARYWGPLRRGKNPSKVKF